MAQVRLSSSFPFELRAPSFSDAALTPPPQPPHSFSYLLSRRDVMRYTPDSPACPSPLDNGIEFSQLVSSPCSTSDQDHSLVESISEDDRASLLPIIRIAFPSLRHSMQHPRTSWYLGVDDKLNDGVRQDHEMEALHYQSIDTEGSMPENLAAGLQYQFIPTIPSAIAEMHDASGVRSEEFGHRADGTGGSFGGIEQPDTSSKVEEFDFLQRSDTRKFSRDDNPSLPASSGCGELNLLSNFSCGLGFSDRVALESWDQGQSGSPVDECSELIHDGHLGGAPTSIYSGISHLERRSSKCSEATDQSHASQPFLAAPKAGVCDGCLLSDNSEPEERASFGRTIDLGCGFSRSEKLQMCSIRKVSPVAVSEVDHSKLPEVNRKRRNVTKKAVGWVGNRKPSPSYSASVSQKHKRGLTLCTSFEEGSKKRRLSDYTSCGAAHISSPPEAESLFSSKESQVQVKAARKLNINPGLNADPSAMDATPNGEESSLLTDEWVNSPLSTALFLILLESGSHGISVCEALRKLLKEGCSKLFILNGQPRAVQVKMTLRRCPDFKQLRSRRYILRNCRRTGSKKRNIKRASHESVAREHVHEKGFSMKLLCDDKPQKAGEHAEQVHSFCAASSDRSRNYGQEQTLHQCRKTDGKQWRCSQQAKLGFLYCDHHYQCRSKAKRKGHSPGKVFHPDIQVQKLQMAYLEGESRDLLDGCARQYNAHPQDGHEPKVERCRRTDGRHWRCSKLIQAGSIYCEHHQVRRKKMKAKDSGPSQTAVVGKAKQDFALTCVKEKTKGSVHGQIPVTRETKQNIHGANTCITKASQIGCKRKVKPSEHARLTPARQIKQELLTSEPCDLDMHHRRALGLDAEEDRYHGQLKGAQEAKQDPLGIKAGDLAKHMFAIHGWNGKTNHNGQHVVCSAVDLSLSSVNSGRKPKAEQYGVITKERDGALNLARSLTASNGWCPAEEHTDLQAKDVQQLERCHRKDGKQWQCSQLCKPGYIYCEHHQGRRQKKKPVDKGQPNFVDQKEGSSHRRGCPA